MNKKVCTIIIICVTSFYINSAAQKTARPALGNIKNFKVANREIAVSKQSEKDVVHLNAKAGDGIAWINNINFGKGIVEFDVKGKNVMQQSFVGIAFHGADDSTFDAVYFRPFNFQSPDAARKSHSVQYISMPKYDWSVLRQNYPDKYESALTGTIDPESWFHAKIVVEADKITVYVNNDTKPSLVVSPLTKRTTGDIGFWVGNNSDGDFANLTITQ
jgi:hypothetical protein